MGDLVMMRWVLVLLLVLAAMPAEAASSRLGDPYHAVDFGARCDGGSDARPGINAAIAAAHAAGGGTVMLPRGTCRVDLSHGRIIPLSNVTLAGQGIGVTTVLIDDSQGGTDGIGNRNGGATFTALDHFTLRDLTVKGMADTIHTTGAQVIRLSGTNITIERVESRYSRNFGMVVVSSDNVAVRDCQVFRSIGDGIAVWSTPNAIIAGNRIEGANDDAISAHSNDTDPAPVRSGLIIADNTITESQGISVGGAKIVSIHGNVLRRVMAYGFNIWAGNGTQGDTPMLAVAIYGNIATDVFRRAEPHPRNAEHAYLRINGGVFRRGRLAAVPGRPASGTGAVADLYGGNGPGTLYANRTRNDAVATPGSFFVDIHDNIFMRTLPPVAAVSQWGYRSSAAGLWVGNNGDGSGFYNGAIAAAALNTDGIQTVGPLRRARIAGNLIATTGQSCIKLQGGEPAHAYDGLVISGNTCRDYSGYGVVTSSSGEQRVTIDGNDFDADPRFVSAGRGAGGTWTARNVLPVGIYMPNAGGVVIAGNRFQNLSGADVTGAGQHLSLDNLLIGQPAATGFSTANRGIGLWPVMDRGWRFLVVDSDPTSATYGQTLFAPPGSAAAMPTTGTWVTGAFVANSGVASGRPACGQTVLGWRRVRTGNGNAANTDWHAELNGATQYSTVTLDNGDAYLVPGWANAVALSAAGGAIAAATLTLPDPASEPDACRIAFLPTGTVAAFTVRSAGAGTVIGAPTTLAPGQPFAFMLAGTAWIRAP